MKLVLFEKRKDGNSEKSEGIIRPGLMVKDGVIDLWDVIPGTKVVPKEEMMIRIIEKFETLKGQLESLSFTATPTPIEQILLRPPLPRPGKILCCIGNYWEHSERDPRPLNLFLKNPDAVIGPNDTVVLPMMDEPYVFHHEAELAIVTKGPSKHIEPEAYNDAIFGYTCLIDVSARASGRRTWRDGSWMGKSFDTFAPIGPCIVTADEILDPNYLRVRFWDNGELRHDYNTSDMEHRVPEIIGFATSIMTLNNGDIISCGTNHEGLGPLQDGDLAEIEIEQIGKLSVGVFDPLKRKWPRGVYLGPDSTARNI